jgi:hypothetical protein
VISLEPISDRLTDNTRRAGMFMSVLDTSIVNVAIPSVQGVFGASPDDIEWIATAYTLCLGVVVPTSAWLGERLGLRRTYLAALLLFALFSAMCGTANDLSAMIVYRILQAGPGKWVVGGIIGATLMDTLADRAHLARLDEACGGRPVLLRDDSMHNRWVSSRALELMGVGRIHLIPRAAGTCVTTRGSSRVFCRSWLQRSRRERSLTRSPIPGVGLIRR